jgi:hypothetical protein
MTVQQLEWDLFVARCGLAAFAVSILVLFAGLCWTAFAANRDLERYRDQVRAAVGRAERTAQMDREALHFVVESWDNLCDAHAATRGTVASEVAIRRMRDARDAFNRIIAAAKQSLRSSSPAIETPKPQSGVRVVGGDAAPETRPEAGHG